MIRTCRSGRSRVDAATRVAMTSSASAVSISIQPSPYAVSASWTWGMALIGLRALSSRTWLALYAVSAPWRAAVPCWPSNTTSTSGAAGTSSRIATRSRAKNPNRAIRSRVLPRNRSRPGNRTPRATAGYARRQEAEGRQYALPHRLHEALGDYGGPIVPRAVVTQPWTDPRSVGDQLARPGRRSTTQPHTSVEQPALPRPRRRGPAALAGCPRRRR